MFEEQNNFYNFSSLSSEEIEDLTPSNILSDTFDGIDLMNLGFEEDSSFESSRPSTPVKENRSINPNRFSYPHPNFTPKNTLLHQQSYAPIYYQQMQPNNTQQTQKNDFLPIGTNLPFWSAAPLPFTPQKFPPQEIVPDNKSLT